MATTTIIIIIIIIVVVIAIAMIGVGYGSAIGIKILTINHRHRYFPHNTDVRSLESLHPHKELFKAEDGNEKICALETNANPLPNMETSNATEK